MTCSMRLEGISQNRYDSIDDFNVNVVEIMHSTAKEVIGKGSGLKQHKVVPWWSDECNKAIKARNKAFRKVKGSFSFNNLIEYKKTQAEVRRAMRKTKRNYWKQFCNNIGRETHISQVWGMIRRMGGIRREYTLPAIKYNNEIMITNKDKAEALAKTFVKVHSSTNLTPGARKGRD